MDGYLHARGGCWFRWTGRLALLALLIQPGLAMAQSGAGSGVDRVLVPGDEIAVTVPGRPDLDRGYVLDTSGRVTVPRVGEVVLGGLTVDEAGEVLRQRLRLFYPNLDALEVELSGSSVIRLYVIGAVRTPGSLEFPVLPNIWDVLRAAGGPADDADLRAARIVRETSGAPEVIWIDLSGVLSGKGAPTTLLQNGDTLMVPSVGEGTVFAMGGTGVRIFGAVETPRVVTVDEPTHLVELLMHAGTPSETSDLKKVWWVHVDDAGYHATKVNVRAFLEDGDPLGNPLIFPGDTVEIEYTRPNWLQRNLPLILGSIATTATVLLAYDRLVND